jgi:hypothetical protein
MGSAASTNGKVNGPNGKKFNQTYMLARELGSGAFSVVKLAMHLVSPRLLTSLSTSMLTLSPAYFTILPSLFRKLARKQPLK